MNDVLFPFPPRYISAMRRLEPPVIRTRDDLLKLIADAIRLQLRYLSDDEARSAADNILRTFKIAGLSISRARRERESPEVPRWFR